MHLIFFKLYIRVNVIYLLGVLWVGIHFFSHKN